MNVNDHFNDFPIDYFKIEPEDFLDPIGLDPQNIDWIESFEDNSLNNYQFERLDLDDYGYIGDSLSQKLNFNVKDTTVVNCAVGQGKTTAILTKLKEEYDKNPKAIFVIAVPFVSLIEQYKRDLISLEIDEDDIFDYSLIGRNFLENILYRSGEGYTYTHTIKRIHLVTVNCLLGNPGKDAIMQSDAKFEYVQLLLKKIIEGNFQTFIIFDEIHDAIPNFSKVGIIQLFLWQDVVDKIIVLSATFNIASISVIKYFSLLTEGKIKILESEREIKRQQSELFLHFDNSDYRYNTSTLKQIISRTVRRNRTLDILSYSKELSKNIVKRDTPIGNMLFEKYGSIRLCVSELIEDIDPDVREQGNRFNNEFCNVGTNFKSGVSIRKENHTFIIILPPAGTRRTYKSVNGVFSEGINSITQALARQRNVGEIHIILPHPLPLDYTTLDSMSEEQVREFQQNYDLLSINREQNRNNVEIPRNKIIPFSAHKEIINLSYEKLANRLIFPIIKASLFNIEFPDKVEYTLNNAERILTSEGFLGRDLSCYVTYSAFTNQFYNARLAGVTHFSPIRFDDIDPQLEDFYQEYHSNEENRTKRISEKYQDFKHRFLSVTNTNFSSNDARTVKEKIVSKLVSNTDLNQLKSDSFKYLVSEYQGLERFSNQESSDLINKLKEFIRRFKESLLEIRQVNFIKDYRQNPLFESDRSEILRVITGLKEINPALNLSAVNFFRNINNENAGKMMYKYNQKIYLKLSGLKRL